MSEVPRPTFILTAELDAESFAWLDGLRREHFPPERNVLSAHLTMFHRLSPEHVDRLLAVPIPARPIAIAFDGVTFLGFGNAIHARSGGLELLRQKLKDDLRGGFSPQDGQRWSPHVTVQNKAPPEAARHVFEKLKRQVSPRSGDATGLLVWEYLGDRGDWRTADRSNPDRRSDPARSGAAHQAALRFRGEAFARADFLGEADFTLAICPSASARSSRWAPSQKDSALPSGRPASFHM